MTDNKTTKRGGRREGAGRKRGEKTTAKTFRLNAQAAAILDTKVNQSEFVNKAIIYYHENS